MTERERHGVEMAKVGILMGSDSDLEIMSKAAKMLEDFGIDYEMNVISAHREPDVFVEYAKTAKALLLQIYLPRAILRLKSQYRRFLPLWQFY